MGIYKSEQGKIVIYLQPTDCLFHDNDKDDALITIDKTAMDDVELVLPPLNDSIGMIYPLTTEQFSELQDIMRTWLKKQQER